MDVPKKTVERLHLPDAKNLFSQKRFCNLTGIKKKFGLKLCVAKFNFEGRSALLGNNF